MVSFYLPALARKMAMRTLLLVSLQKYGAGPVDSWELSEALSRREYPHVLLVSNGNELRSRLTNTRWRRLREVPTFESRFFHFVVATITLLRPLILFLAVFRENPSFVLVTHFHPWVVVVLCATRLRRAKFFYTLHDNPFAPKERGLSLLATHLEKFFCRHADLVVTHSNFVRNAVATYLQGKPIFTIPLGAYTHLCKNASSVTSRHTPHFLFLGRIEPFKGIEVLVEAYRMVRERLPTLTLTIAGRGKIPEPLCNKMEQLGIRLVNRWLSTEETCALMREADVVVLPYRDATQSGVISLAMAHGLPVIASAVGGLPEQVIDGKTGFLVKPGDARDLSQKMEILAKDESLRRQFRENQLKLASTTFSWDTAAEKLIEILKSFD